MMDDDFGYDDLVEKEPKGRKKAKSKIIGVSSTPDKPKLLLPVLFLLVMVLLIAGGFFLWSRPGLLPFLAQVGPGPSQEPAATDTPSAPLPTDVAGISISTEIPPTATIQPPTEVPAEPTPQALVPLPEYGYLVQTRAGGGDREGRAAAMASDTAVREPFTWEYLEFDAGTLIKDVESYYIAVINQGMGYKMTFNERYPNSALAIFKFKQDERRITIQFFEGQPDQAPAAYLFYEGW